MFRVQIKDVGIIQTFLAVAETDFIDALLSKNYVTLFVNQAELFGSLTLSANANSEDTDIRIPKVILTKLLREGTLEFHIDNDTIKIVMINDKGNKYCSASFVKQGFLKTDYKSKLSIVDRAKASKTKIVTSEFEGLEKIMRLSRSTLNVANGVAMLVTQNGRVYKEVNSNYKFAITPFAYSILKRCSDTLIDVDNNLVAIREGLVIVATKCKGFDNTEYSIFTQEKASAVCKIDLTDLKYFTYKMNLDYPVIELDLSNRVSKFVATRIDYEIPIHISDLKTVNGTANDIKLPFSIMKEVLYNINVSELTLAKKRTFTQIRCGKFLIVF